jgi:hypothetical protein
VSSAAAAALEAARVAASRLPVEKRAGAEKKLKMLAAEATTSLKRYAPQSATIQGILSDMYDTFTSSLESKTKEESTRQTNYEDLMSTYKSELDTLQESLEKKERKKAEDELMLADATQDYAGTEASLKADVEFFDITKGSCETKTEEWSARKTLREQELEGITQALDILSSDESKELFAKAIKPGFEFLQISAASSSAIDVAVDHAFEALRVQAKKTHSLRLAALAASVQDERGSRQLGHFDKVLEAIDMMVDTLKDEEKEDIAQNDECLSQMHDITKKKEDLDWKITKSGAKIEKLGKTVAAKTEEKATVEKELVDVEKEIEDMGTKRTEDNQAFLQAKEDDEKAIGLLESAKEKLAQFYAEAAPALAQTGAHQEPEAKFTKEGQNKNEAKGIVALLETIAEDLQREISNAVANEEAAQLAHEKQLAAAEAMAEEMRKRITNLDETVALKEEEQAAAETVKGEHEAELTTQETTETDLKPNCDWIKENLAPRRTKRAQEMEGLRNAKQYLAGMRPSML